MYVVMLEDGHEIHLPSSKVEVISIVVPPVTHEPSESESAYKSIHGGGHPSSLQVLDTTDVFSDVAIGDYFYHRQKDNPNPSRSMSLDSFKDLLYGKRKDVSQSLSTAAADVTVGADSVSYLFTNAVTPLHSAKALEHAASTQCTDSTQAASERKNPNF